MDDWDSEKERLAEALNIRNNTAKQQPIVSSALEILKTSPVLNELPEILKQHKPRKRRDYRCGKCGMVKKNHTCPKLQNMNFTHGSCSFAGSSSGRSEKRKSYKPLKLVLVENDQPETRQYLMELQLIGVEKIGIQLFVITKKAAEQEDFDIVVQAVYGNRAPTYIGKVSWYYKGIVRTAIEDNSITKVELLKIYEDESLWMTPPSVLDTSYAHPRLLPRIFLSQFATPTTTANGSDTDKVNFDTYSKNCYPSVPLPLSAATSALERTNVVHATTEYNDNAVMATNSLLTTDINATTTLNSANYSFSFSASSLPLEMPLFGSSNVSSEFTVTMPTQTLTSSLTNATHQLSSVTSTSSLSSSPSSSSFLPTSPLSTSSSHHRLLLPLASTSSPATLSNIISPRKILTAQLAIYRNQSWHTKKLQESNYSSSNQLQA
jgi:hypothetical protein